MEQEEFRRRIRVYLDTDLADLADADRVATALSQRLFQYVRQPELPEVGESTSLQSLLADERVLLFFTAQWDGSAPGYREIVGRMAEGLGVRVVDVDIDDPVGAGMTRLYGVMSTPCLIDTSEPSRRVLGARTEGHLRELFASEPQAVIEEWFRNRGFGLLVEPAEGGTSRVSLTRLPWGHVVAPDYGHGNTPQEAVARAKERHETEQ